MEMECFGRGNPSVTLATGEVGGVLSSRDRAPACQSHCLQVPLIGKTTCSGDVFDVLCASPCLRGAGLDRSPRLQGRTIPRGQLSVCVRCSPVETCPPQPGHSTTC
ncbi:hypothetical protein PAMA_017426 [Pampus argenteus]